MRHRHGLLVAERHGAASVDREGGGIDRAADRAAGLHDDRGEGTRRRVGEGHVARRHDREHTTGALDGVQGHVPVHHEDGVAACDREGLDDEIRITVGRGAVALLDEGEVAVAGHGDVHGADERIHRELGGRRDRQVARGHRAAQGDTTGCRHLDGAEADIQIRNDYDIATGAGEVDRVALEYGQRNDGEVAGHGHGERARRPIRQDQGVIPGPLQDQIIRNVLGDRRQREGRVVRLRRERERLCAAVRNGRHRATRVGIDVARKRAEQRRPAGARSGLFAVGRRADGDAILDVRARRGAAVGHPADLLLIGARIGGRIGRIADERVGVRQRHRFGAEHVRRRDLEGHVGRLRLDLQTAQGCVDRVREVGQ